MSLVIVNDNVSLSELNQVVVNSSVSTFRRIDPVTKTGTFVVNDTFDTYIYNSASAVTVILPSAVLYSGRALHFRNTTSNAASLSSDASNVVPIAGGAATALIIALTGLGKSATLLSNGTNWVIIRSISPA
jgi:hypothetical protein